MELNRIVRDGKQIPNGIAQGTDTDTLAQLTSPSVWRLAALVGAHGSSLRDSGNASLQERFTLREIYQTWMDMFAYDPEMAGQYALEDLPFNGRYIVRYLSDSADRLLPYIAVAALGEMRHPKLLGHDMHISAEVADNDTMVYTLFKYAIGLEGYAFFSGRVSCGDGLQVDPRYELLWQELALDDIAPFPDRSLHALNVQVGPAQVEALYRYTDNIKYTGDR